MSGLVPADEKHVVALELQGPQSEEQYAAFRDAVEAVAKRYNAKIIVRARGKKDKSAS